MEFLDDIASRTRFGMLPDVAQAIAHITYDALPIRSLRAPSREQISATEIDLIEYGLSVGAALSYDGALYIKDIKVVDVGSELLWKILRFARINKQDDLQKRALQDFDIAEDGAKRGGDPDALMLVQLYREHGLSGDWHNPIYGGRLLSRIS